jgi:hypothetical protein
MVRNLCDCPKVTGSNGNRHVRKADHGAVGCRSLADTVRQRGLNEQGLLHVEIVAIQYLLHDPLIDLVVDTVPWKREEHIGQCFQNVALYNLLPKTLTIKLEKLTKDLNRAQPMLTNCRLILL